MLNDDGSHLETAPGEQPGPSCGPRPWIKPAFECESMKEALSSEASGSVDGGYCAS